MSSLFCFCLFFYSLLLPSSNLQGWKMKPVHQYYELWSEELGRLKKLLG